MAFPWVFESNFENRTTPFGWDSESDTDSVLDVPHYSELARFPWSECAPYRGASCLRIALNGGTNDATLTEGDIDIAADATRWFRFYLYLASDFTATADDTLNIFELQQAAGTVEGVIGLRITASTGAVEIGVGETAPTAFAASTLARNQWYAIELRAVLDDGGTNDGTLDLYVDGSASLASVTALDQGAVGQGVLGVQNQLATTTGTILMDQFIMDDLQIYPFRERFPLTQILTQSGHAFIGPGNIESASLLSTGSTDTMYLYDTDTANTNDASSRVIELDIAAHTTASDHGSIHFERGCYVALSGTNPRGQIILPRSLAPAAYTAAMVRHYGRSRRQRTGDV